MSRTLVIDSVVYEYKDAEWEKLLEGELSAPETVLRQIIKRHRANLLQLIDEVDFREGLIEDVQEDVEKLRAENATLKAEQALGWETKPARAKRKKKEAA